jgi:hypothetical protein
LLNVATPPTTTNCLSKTFSSIRTTARNSNADSADSLHHFANATKSNGHNTSQHADANIKADGDHAETKVASTEHLTMLDASAIDANLTTDGTQEVHTVQAEDAPVTDHPEDPTVSDVSLEVKTHASTSRTTAQSSANPSVISQLADPTNATNGTIATTTATTTATNATTGTTTGKTTATNATTGKTTATNATTGKTTATNANKTFA